MPQKIPFHRRVLPWLFTLIFLIFAPVLVFYTAGYRWNPKKGLVEKNGTLILDTQPRGADIHLNGRLLDDKTPTTLQNVAPGKYTVKLSKTGYHNWQKTLNVLQERVTFANDIILWLDSDPEKILNYNVEKLLTNQNDDFILGFAKKNQVDVLFRYEKQQIEEEIFLADSFEIQTSVWDRSGEKALLTTMASNTEIAWLLTADPLSLVELPPARYHFERSKLVGIDDTYRMSLSSAGSLSKQRHNERIYDSYEELIIKRLPGQENLVLLMQKDAEQGFLLPDGDWQFYNADREEIVLRNQDEWLRINTHTQPFTTTKAVADYIEKMEIDDEKYFLLIRHNELYLWPPLQEPELLYRQSRSIVKAGAHPKALSVYFATDKEVRMMNLDNRDGRMQTVLSEFDSINDVVLFTNSLYVSGDKNNETAVWKLPLEKNTNFSPLSGINNMIIF